MTSVHLPEASFLNYSFQYACLLDVATLKPGNVGWHSCGHGMDAGDFFASAAACGHTLCAPGHSLGERILRAIEQTRQVVNCNTNLGIVLLCAPLIQGALTRSPGGLRGAVEYVLRQTTVNDARQAYAAIRLAQPGGMGRMDHDIQDEPKINLLDAMRLSAERDQIGAQYAEGYRFLFETVTPLFVELVRRWGYDIWAAAGVYMTLLGSRPDSLIARRYGLHAADDIMRKVRPLAKEFVGCKRPQDFERRLLDLDQHFKENGFNPGTTADMVVGGVFIASLEGALRGMTVFSS